MASSVTWTETEPPLSGAKLAVRLAWVSAASALAGLVGACSVWFFIGLEHEREIPYHIINRLDGSVCGWGLTVGWSIGIVTPLLRRHHFLMRWLVAAHVIAILAGFWGGSSDWKTGLWAYFGTLAAYQLLMLWRALFDYTRPVPYTWWDA